MRIPLLLVLLGLTVWSFAGCGSKAAEPARPAATYENVDPFIATGGTGFGQGSAYPGALVPYGLVKLSPDTQGDVFGRAAFAHYGGYWYGDSKIEGFSHIHMHGVGIAEGGTLTFMPVLDFDETMTRFDGYATGFTHSDEQAEPGYYRVGLENGIEVELTATPRTGGHRYHFPPDAQGSLIVDLAHGLEGVDITGGELELLPGEQRVRGWFTQDGAFSGRYGGVTYFFDAKFSASWIRSSVWNDERFQSDAVEVTAPTGEPIKRLGAALDFAPGSAVEVAVGVSVVSQDGARLNREQEVGTAGFDVLAERAREAWREPLSSIRVWGGTPKQQRIFYTALYHTMHMPTVYGDTDGAYRTAYQGRAEAEGWDFYSDLSLWDTYRTLHPLVTLLDGERASDFAQSLVAMGESRGALPRWPMGTGDGGSMIATPADMVIADTYLKGVTDFDVESAFALMVSSATLGDPFSMRPALDAYLAWGYCPAVSTAGSVSKTLESMYADFAIAQLAGALDKPDVEASFRERAMSYGALFDAGTGFFRGKTTDGSWSSATLDPTEHSEDFVEGTAWQYLWFVPWDVQGLVELLGGEAPFVEKLTRFFAMAEETPTTFVGTIQFPDDYYWHGNEPDIHAAYLFAMAGDHASTVRWVEWIRETKYDDTAAGLDGNDDGGTLSAWYVFSALGLYPLPAETRYVLGAPLFERAEVELSSGSTLRVEWAGASDKGATVSAISWNGQVLPGAFLEHDALIEGGTLRFHP